jgi:PAS domain S-box-containing protein
MENSPAMMFLKDAAGRYLHFNRRFAQEFHLTIAEAVGRTDDEVFDATQAEVFRANDRRVIETGLPLQFDEVAQHHDGLHTSIVTKFPLRDEAGKVYAVGGIVTDITERKRLEAEVAHISEREQRRISTDLHDGLGQRLAGIACLSDVLVRDLADANSPLATGAAKVARLLNEAVGETRNLARGLYPVEPEPQGLMSSLQALAERTQDIFRVRCRFVCRRPVLVEDNLVATHLYRIAQEAVGNAVRHGRSRSITIRLSPGPRSSIVMGVQDDGVGIRRPGKPTRGMGLRIMQYRAGMIDATVVVQRRPGRGTSVVCNCPRPSAPRTISKSASASSR